MDLHNDGDFALFDWAGDEMRLLEDTKLLGPLIEQFKNADADAKRKKDKRA